MRKSTGYFKRTSRNVLFHNTLLKPAGFLKTNCVTTYIVTFSIAYV
jgi:hypothetical protein